jgi:hypothetical protein
MTDAVFRSELDAAIDLSDDGRWKAAPKAFDRIVKAYPREMQPRFERAMVLLNLERDLDAIVANKTHAPRRTIRPSICQGSCTVLGAPGGETPPGDSTRTAERVAWTIQEPCYRLSLSYGPVPAAPADSRSVPKPDNVFGGIVD